jgi:hypothetical protein
MRFPAELAGRIWKFSAKKLKYLKKARVPRLPSTLSRSSQRRADWRVARPSARPRAKSISDVPNMSRPNRQSHQR